MRKVFTLLVIFCFSNNIIFAKDSKTHIFYEKEYQNYWCNKHKGTTEFVLPDLTRVDCVTEDYAIEFDFAKKWAESIGQSLYYANILNKQPGIVLIIENQNKDEKYLKRIETITKQHNIQLWTITPSTIQKEKAITF